MIPRNITHEHILKAITEIDEKGVPPGREQQKYSLIWNGKLYPPKYTISIANKHANGEELDPSAFSGGDETNPFLNKLDFTVIDISQWETITDHLKNNFDTRSENKNLLELINSKNEVLSKYQPIFSPSHIPKLTAEEFSEFLDFKNNKHWSGLHRQKGIVTQDMERLKSALLTLVDESLPVQDRLDRIKPVPGIGEAISTAILHITNSDKYGVWNSTSKNGLEKAGLYPITKRGASFGEQYKAINEVLIALSREIHVDLWTLDALWFDFVKEGDNEFELKQAVLDTISIGETIVKEGLDGKMISKVPGSEVNHQKYLQIIKPIISEFSEKYGNTPNQILKELLTKYATNNDLLEDFEVQHLHFLGRKMNGYTWAAIIKKDENKKSQRVTHFPQLYITIGAFGIRYGFAYGVQVKEDDKRVKLFNSDEDLQKNVNEILKSHPTILAAEKRSPDHTDMVLNEQFYQFNFQKWTNNIIVTEAYPKNNIPDRLKERIFCVFDALFPIFEFATYADDQKKMLELKEKYEAVPKSIDNTWSSVRERIGYSFSDFDFSLKNLYFETEEDERIKSQVFAALKSGKHIILIGPPGTGKSKLAQEICEKIVGQGNYQMATASSDWSTYETIGGYRPDQEGKLFFFPGIFLRSFQNTNGQPINKWLVIDEINRADIDKAFGALFSALTGDTVTIPFEINGEFVKIIGNPIDSTPIKSNAFIIHPDWRIIATMNTFDKSSLYEMSYAFMRRFAFIPVNTPSFIDENLMKNYTQKWGMNPPSEIIRNVASIWQTVNKRRKIGPAIIHDILSYISESDRDVYESSIIMLILPQFEGLVEEEQIGFIRDIIALDCISKKKYLINYASEFFGIAGSRFK